MNSLPCLCPLRRELISQLFSSCYPDILSASMIGKGFERLFELADELEKDVPSARDNISTFLARCVVDEGEPTTTDDSSRRCTCVDMCACVGVVLPPSFLSDIVVCNLGGDIVDHAKRMLSREHAGESMQLNIPVQRNIGQGV